MGCSMVDKMTEIRKETFECKCGEIFETEYYTSVNVTLNPELRDEILNERLNMVRCPSCGHLKYSPRL